MPAKPVKRGRPRTRPPVAILVHVTATERRAIKTAAKTAVLSVSEFVRNKMLEGTKIRGE